MIKPFNRHLLLEQCEVERQESSLDKPVSSAILVPEGYKPKPSHELYKVVDMAEDCNNVNKIKLMDRVVVNNSTVEEISINDKTFYLVLENYIYGVYEED